LIDLKNFHKRLNENLNILQQREAKYGGNAPLELLNQIDDYKEAIILTEQVKRGELTESEWREALKPLLVFHEAPPFTPRPSLSPAEAKERRDLRILLNKVKSFWIEGVLEKSIHTKALLDLGKTVDANAVEHPWERVLELPNQTQQSLPPGKKICDIFDEMQRALLILGEPGSGKTITLLELARDLIRQAEVDESFTQPIPVVLNLSSWTKGQPLVDWLVAELSVKYQIPKRISRPWLENNRLLPLLDGLDEVKTENRVACVETINAFGEAFGLIGLVVCSRLKEYIDLPVRLKLNGAIRLQALTPEQVNNYLEMAGPRLESLRDTLQKDKPLLTLVQSPLMLNIMSLAYQDSVVLTGQTIETVEARRKHLFDAYIERMFKRKRTAKKTYTDQQTTVWLIWLAEQMTAHNQTIFLIEQLQPSWLSTRLQRWAYVLISRLTTGSVIGLPFGLAVGLMSGLGGLVGIIDGIRFGRNHRDENVKLATPSSHRLSIKHIPAVGLSIGLIVGLITGLTFILEYDQQLTWDVGEFIDTYFKYFELEANQVVENYSPIIKLIVGLIVGLTSGLMVGLIFEIIFGQRGNQQNIQSDIKTIEAMSWSSEEAKRGARRGLTTGLVIGLIIGVLQVVVGDFFGELLFLPIFGLIGVLMGVLSGAVIGGLHGSTIERRTAPNQGVWLSAKNAASTGLIFWLIFWLIIGLINWLVFRWDYGPIYSLFEILWLGLLIGLIAMLRYGAFEFIKHFTLRFLLWHSGYIPRNYAHFLDYATERIFLQKIGGGYIFIHRLLLEHFVAMKSGR
jgi:DNA polymerase III delta prime subunit